MRQNKLNHHQPFKIIRNSLATALIAAPTALAALSAQAQTNTATGKLPPPPPPKWETSASLGVTITGGNTRTELITGNFQTQRKTPLNEFLAGGDGSYGKDTTGTNDVKSAESLHGFTQYNRLATDRLYYGIRFDALHDAVAGVNYRLTAAPLAGYYLLKQTNLSLSTEAGPGFVYQRDSGQLPSDYATLRFGESFEWKFNAGARLWQTVEMLPQIDKFSNYYADGEIGLDTTLTKHLAWTTYIQDTYYNEPTPGRLKNDVKLVSGIKYKF
jgi:putative salt-induced outer membrane protein YdiY